MINHINWWWQSMTFDTCRWKQKNFRFERFLLWNLSSSWSFLSILFFIIANIFDKKKYAIFCEHWQRVELQCAAHYKFIFQVFHNQTFFTTFLRWFATKRILIKVYWLSSKRWIWYWIVTLKRCRHRLITTIKKSIVYA